MDKSMLGDLVNLPEADKLNVYNDRLASDPRQLEDVQFSGGEMLQRLCRFVQAQEVPEALYARRAEIRGTQD